MKEKQRLSMLEDEIEQFNEGQDLKAR
jgi:hypothetical protein